MFADDKYVSILTACQEFTTLRDHSHADRPVATADDDAKAMVTGVTRPTGAAAYRGPMPDAKMVVEAGGREVGVSNPGKIFFPRTGHTKLDLIRYYLAVADGALGGVAGRPMALKRFVNGAEAEPFFQKRAPDKRPDWIETAELRFPSGRTADEVVLRDAAGLAWVVNLGCIDLNPHPVLASDLDHPDELRVDLDPVPGIEWPQILSVALVARGVLADFGLTGWPKTSGSRGMHIYARISPRWSFTDVRRAAVAVAREIERRAPDLATSKWWKEERHGVFVDYNQNAKDRTVASAYSVRPLPDARVSTPLAWDEVPGCDPAAFTIDTVPARFAEAGDPWAGLDAAVGSLDALLELADRDEAAGLPDAPWPPNYEKQAGEAPRVQPSKRRSSAGKADGAGDAGGVEAAAADGADGAGAAPKPTGRRKSTKPLIEIARAETKAEALAGLDRWKERHADVWPLLEPADVLVDSMRGRSSTWTRIRLNLEHVPEQSRPPQEPLEVDYDPWVGFQPPQ
jgi:bifunctional non-homologous end joining protein LigD